MSYSDAVSIVMEAFALGIGLGVFAMVARGRQ